MYFLLWNFKLLKLKLKERQTEQKGIKIGEQKERQTEQKRMKTGEQKERQTELRRNATMDDVLGKFMQCRCQIKITCISVLHIIPILVKLNTKHLFFRHFEKTKKNNRKSRFGGCIKTRKGKKYFEIC